MDVENERPLPARACRTDCLTWSALIREKQFISDTTARKNFAINIKPDEADWKLQNHIYLIIFTHCDIQYVGKSITPFNHLI